MLKDLNIMQIEPQGLIAMLAPMHNVDITDADSMFNHYETGVYRHDGFKFNFDFFIESNCTDNILDKWVEYGVCDNYEQVINHHKKLLDNPDKYYVIGLSTVRRGEQPDDGG